MTPEKFKVLPKVRRRILIAKDVLLRIKLKQFKPGVGYKSFNTKLTNCNTDVRNAISANKIKCEGCAKGGIFFSAIALKDSMNLGAARSALISWGNSFMLEEFTQRQLDLIETAYENIVFTDSCSYQQHQRAKKFGDKYNNRDERLKAIMKNIIKNEGTFKP